MVFQALQPEHWPVHRGKTLPQSLQAYVVFNFAMLIFFLKAVYHII
jgi:hypothetical protein